jgi:hypothetical protein
MRMLGILVTIIGIGLLIGNVSHAFYTFPFAGTITIFIGGAMIKAGR